MIQFNFFCRHDEKINIHYFCISEVPIQLKENKLIFCFPKRVACKTKLHCLCIRICIIYIRIRTPDRLYNPTDQCFHTVLYLRKIHISQQRNVNPEKSMKSHTYKHRPFQLFCWLSILTYNINRISKFKFPVTSNVNYLQIKNSFYYIMNLKL